MKSLASRLARATPKVEPQSEAVKSEPLSAAAREHIEEITRRRKEARIARETAKANAAIDRIMPMSDISKIVQAASSFKVGSVPLPSTTRPQPVVFRNNAPRRERSPAAASRKTSTRRQQEQHPPVTPIVEVATQEPTKIHLSELVANTPEETLVGQAQIEDIELEEGEDNIDLSDANPSPMFQNTKLREEIASTIYKSREELIKEGLVLDTKPLTQEELVAESAAKRREERLRRQAAELRMKRNVEDLSDLKPELRDSIAQRKAARLARLESAREEAPARRARRKTKAPSLDSLVSGPELAEETYGIEDTEDNVGPAFTGPEPISATLFEIFQPSILASQSAVVSSPKKAGSRIGAVFAHHVGQPSLLYSTPPDQLGPVNVAKAVLAHRPDISRPKRKHALDIIIASTQRSKQTPARA